MTITTTMMTSTTTTILATAPQAPEYISTPTDTIGSYDSLEDLHNMHSMHMTHNMDEPARRRKYSEGYREVEAVDSPLPVIMDHGRRQDQDQDQVEVQDQVQDQDQSKSIVAPASPSSSLTVEEADDDADADADADEGKEQKSDKACLSHKSLPKCHKHKHTTSTATATATATTLRPTRVRSESFWNSLPIATAEPEIPRAIAQKKSSASASSASSSSLVTSGTTRHGSEAQEAVQVVRLPPVVRVEDDNNIHNHNNHNHNRRASLISVKVFKATRDTKLGIRLQLSNDGNLQLGKIMGFMADAPLRPGDEVLRINGQNVSAWTTTKALTYLREAWGWITIVVRNNTQTLMGGMAADPSLCLASVCKSSPSDKLGISFERVTEGTEDNTNDDHPSSSISSSSPLTIRGLNVAGLLGGRTTIRIGDVVESINQVPCAHFLEISEAVSMIRSVPDWVHILVRSNPVESVMPAAAAAAAAAQEGLAVADHEVEVSFPSSSSQPAAVTNDNTVMDHDHDSHDNYDEELVEQPEEDNNHNLNDTILAATELANPLSAFQDRDEYTEASLVSVTMYKELQSDKLGLQLVRLDEEIYIKKISGFLAGSVLKEGMVLVSINQQMTAGMALSDATCFLKERIGSITLVARNPHGNPKYVQAMVFKKTSQAVKGNLVGVSFKGSTGRPLKICHINPEGLFVESCLNVGDSVLQINDVPCRCSRPKDAVELVRSGLKCVSILAKAKSKTGVVVAMARGGSITSGNGSSSSLPASNVVVSRSA